MGIYLKTHHYLVLIIIITGLVGCVRSSQAPTPMAILPALPSLETPSSSSELFPVSEIKFFISSEVPSKLKDLIQLPSEIETVYVQAEANVLFGVCKTGDVQTRWYYLEVEPFENLIVTPTVVIISDETGKLMGYLDADQPLEIIASERVYDQTKQKQQAIAMIPFDALSIQWRTRDPIPGRAVDFCLTGDMEAIQSLTNTPGFFLPESNFDPERVTVLAMTGVTALVRQTAVKMDERGVLYPAEKIGEKLRNADITHISNEVSFSNDCQVTWNGTKFCSKPEYFELLKTIGTDIVELTGNHEMDYGAEPFLFTLNLYQTNGMKYFGGGKDLTEASMPLFIEHNDNKLVFIGCNRVGPEFDWATDDTPGSNPCDMDLLQEQVRDLKESGYLPIVTFQHLENCDFVPLPAQRGDFYKAAESGAVIVSGSQAHCPQTVEFRNGAFIHYGLGNLFFDQTDLIQRTGFIDEYTFYNGQLISINLIPIVIENQAQPRLMNQKEKTDFLKQIFDASDW